MKIALLFPVLFLFAAPLRASVAGELLDQLRNELKAEARAAQEQGEDGKEQLAKIEEILTQIQNASADDETGYRLERNIEGFGNFTLSEKIEKTCKALATELRTSREQRERALQENMTKTFADALQAGLDAKASKDLDGPLASVAKFVGETHAPGNLAARNAPAPHDFELQQLTEEGRQLRQFLLQWQECLAALESRDELQVQQKLGGLTANGRDFSRFMPRSNFVARIDALRKTRDLQLDLNPQAAPGGPIKVALDIIASVKELNEMAGALAKIENLSLDLRGRSDELGGLIARLRSLNFNYDEVKAGLATRQTLGKIKQMSDDDRVAAFARLERKLFLFAFPRMLGLPESEVAGPEESVTAFVQRCLTDSEAKNDWAAVERIVYDVQTYDVPGVVGPADQSALRAFLSGSNLERAGQLSLAVASYQEALRTGSQIVPAETIGARLAAIKKLNPEEFEKGMQITPAPASPRSTGS